MLLNDLFKIAGEDGDIAGCIALVMRGGPTAKYAVLIPAGYNGPSTYSNPQNVPILDLRTNGAGLGGPLAGSVGPAGAAGTTGANGAAGTSNVPWLDIQDYGGIPKSTANILQTTTFTSVSGSPNVTLGTARTNFANGAGICLYKAGAATSQTTPSAPTITSSVVQGGQTVAYACVGYDALGGLTAASLSGTVTNAPKIFGASPQIISSCSVTSNVLTLNFAAPLNSTVSAGMTIHVVGIPLVSGANWNGIFTIVSAPTTQQVTVALTTANGSGSPTSSSTGRVSNTAIITAISRDDTGTISITTAENHNYQFTAVAFTPNVINVEGVYESDGVTWSDLNGWYVITAASGTSITCAGTGNITPETGTLVAGKSTVTCWEYTIVACPALSGDTLGYYIYSDNGSGGTLNLIGKTLYNEYHFVDWGSGFYAAGYVAPTYVPTTAPASAQNQLFSTTIKSGGGTTSLVLNANVPTSISALGGIAVYDDAPCLTAALAVASSNETRSAIFTSPPATAGSISDPVYVFNSPVTFTPSTNLIIGTGLWINETISGFTNCQITTPFGAPYAPTPAFGERNYVVLRGLASPMITGASGDTNGFNIDGVLFENNYSNGQNLLQIFFGSYTRITNCSFDVNAFGTSIPLVYNGACNQMHVENCNFVGSSVLGDNSGGFVPGQSAQGPLVPLLMIRASDNPATENVCCAQFFMAGINTFLARGIGIDNRYELAGSSFNYNFGASIWDQAPTQPLVWFLGGGHSNVNISGVLMDSDDPQVLGNFAGSMLKVRMDDNDALGTLVTGNAITGLTVTGYGSNGAGQNIDGVQELYGTASVGQQNPTPPRSAATLQLQPMSLGSAIFCPVVPATPTASASGSGTFTAGTWTVQIAAVGYDGGETAPTSAEASTVVVNGSQGIQVNYVVPAGMAGVAIFLDGIRQNATFYTGTSHTFSFVTSDGEPNQLDGTGLPCISSTGIVAQRLILPTGGAPSTSSSAGIPGQLAWDGTHIYVCVAANTWVRATLSTF